MQLLIDTWHRDLLAASLHAQDVDTTSSTMASGTDPAVGVAIMVAGLAIFIGCLCIRRHIHDPAL